ncbi:MAG: hypothetical protein IKF83_03955 [Clostridia bacterium]|nr:hypothetical protein [Clostridia bacterium]
MNVTLPEKEKGTGKRKVIYGIILTVCVIAIGLAIYQFFADEKLEVILGLVKSEDEETELLKSEFNNIFTNRIINSQNVSANQKLNENEELIYTEYEVQEKSINNYDININIPYINLKNDLAQQYNDDIKKIFNNPTTEILQTTDRNISYTVNYIASVENNILSLAILSTFKEGDNAQRVMARTYNYDLINNKEIKLKDYIATKEIEKNVVESKIKKEVETAQEQSQKLRELGYNIYSRNSTDSIYKIENTTEFFSYNGHLYILYPYGNNNKTSEMDIVII